jgi:hypothetical protein
VERGFRQLLADKTSGTFVGLWLLVAEHMRLGTWQLLKAWCGATDDSAVSPRLAMQMVHESALCLSGLRAQRSLRHKGFEALNGLPFVASDQAIHALLQEHTVKEAQMLQSSLALLRSAIGHYRHELVLVDPHRIPTTSRRQIPRQQASPGAPATKTLQTFFALDADTKQPLGFDMGSPSVTASRAFTDLLQRIGSVTRNAALVVADAEHCTDEILGSMDPHSHLQLLVPVTKYAGLLRTLGALEYRRCWAGYCVAEDRYKLHDGRTVRMIVQRTGERPADFVYKPFATTSTLPAEQLMTHVYPQRWTIEEFFNLEDALGWDRASTLNLNIRYARLSFALITQALIYGLRKVLPPPITSWTAQHMANKLFMGIDGDIRVHDDTVIVTLYNAPEDVGLRQHYQDLPQRLAHQGIDPRVPWLYGLKVDFRFR